MNNHAPASSDFERAVDNAVCELIQREHFQGVSIIAMPESYDSGAACVIRVEPMVRGHVRVTDGGIGYIEADEFGAAASYTKQASRIAEAAGIKFHKHEFFIERVSYESIAVAVAIVAAASRRAFSGAWEKMVAEKDEHREDHLIERLKSVFREENVKPKAIIAGAQKPDWRVSAIVTWEGRLAAFQSVTERAQSYGPAVAKFWDFEQLPDDRRPICVSAIPAGHDLGSARKLLAAISTVIEDDAPRQRFEAAAAERLTIQ